MENLHAIKPYTSQPTFNTNTLLPTSPAAASLCEWILSVMEYNNSYNMFIKPKEEALKQAREALDAAQEAMQKEDTTCRKLEEDRVQLMSQFEAASAEKNKLVYAQDKAVSASCAFICNSIHVGMSSHRSKAPPSVFIGHKHHHPCSRQAFMKSKTKNVCMSRRQVAMHANNEYLGKYLCILSVTY